MLEETDTPSPLIPAATILLLRDTTQGIETLLLRRNKALKAFGGAWVFPGGRVDDCDAPGCSELDRSRATAIRETEEETGLDISGAELVSLSNWIPPTAEIRRFSTWFFMAKAPDKPVRIDEGEIHDYQWISPQTAIERIPSPDLVVMPPTYISIHRLLDFTSADEALEAVAKCPNEHFKTKFTRHFSETHNFGFRRKFICTSEAGFLKVRTGS